MAAPTRQAAGPSASPSPRDLVMRRVGKRARQYPDLTIEPLDTAPLAGADPRDFALARAMDQAVAQRWLTLVTIIEPWLNQPWEKLEPKMQAALLVGAAQILLMDRIPAHAAIHQSVEWAKQNIRVKAGGLVNAVLRRVAELPLETIDCQTKPPHHAEDAHESQPWRRDQLPLPDGRIRVLNGNIFSQDPTARLAEQTSHMPALLEYWIESFGWEQTVALAQHSLVHPPIILAGLDDNDIEKTACDRHTQPGFAIFHGGGEALLHLLDNHPEARVQDPTTSEPVDATRHRLFSTILDLCAGKGTKTKQLAALHPEARIIATDVHSGRLEELHHQFDKHKQIEVVHPDEIRRFDEQADLLVLDVPCSNTGVLARRPEAKYRFTRETLEQLTQLQRQIIADSIPLLSPQGAMLYITCALGKDENTDMAEWITRWHNLRTMQARQTLPHAVPGDPPTIYRDGGYFALLQRLPA